MDKHGKPPKKPQPKRPATAPGEPGFPLQDGSAGIKRASAMNDRKPAGKAGGRGR